VSDASIPDLRWDGEVRYLLYKWTVGIDVDAICARNDDGDNLAHVVRTLKWVRMLCTHAQACVMCLQLIYFAMKGIYQPIQSITQSGPVSGISHTHNWNIWRLPGQKTAATATCEAMSCHRCVTDTKAGHWCGERGLQPKREITVWRNDEWRITNGSKEPGWDKQTRDRWLCPQGRRLVICSGQDSHATTTKKFDIFENWKYDRRCNNGDR
jgi:hypothetical protein